MTATAKLPYYDASKVREAATGRWLEVLIYLADNQLGDALRKPGKHVTCPMHGTSGKGRGDGFRFFKDVVNTGGGVCNSCGTFHDGFELLMWLKGWDFRTTLNYVAEIVQIAPEENGSQKKKPIAASTLQASPFAIRDKHQSAKPETQQSVVEAPKGVVATAGKETVVPMFQPTPERIAEIKAMQARLAERVAKEAVEAQERIDRTWYESVSLVDGVPGPLYRYWKRRCILLRQDILTKGDSVRFHPSLPYYDEDDNGNFVVVGKFPAIIAAIRDMSGKIVTLHRTYLAPSGHKAKVECPRKMMSVPDNVTVTGAAIQLGGFPVDGVLGVAEGMETAMSAMRIFRIPTWSCISATILEKFEPPKGVHTLLVWADKDRSLTGQRAAQALKDALAPKGITVYILTPMRPICGKSVDWNDVLVNEGICGFPAWNFIQRLVSGGTVCAS